VDRGYVPRQLCLQALRYSMGELADTARRRLTSLPDPDLCPRWTTVVTRPPALELGADDVWVTPVAVLSDGDVITGNALGLVRRWRTDQPGVPAELGSQDSAVSAVAVLFDDRVVTGGGDGRVRLWRTDQPGVPIEIGTHDGEVTAVAVLSDGSVVTGGRDGRVRLWRTDQPGVPMALSADDDDQMDKLVTTVHMLPDGHVVT
jgi:WD40 repeat protein